MHRDLVLGGGEELFSQSVLLLFFPFLSQEGVDFGVSFYEGAAVAPGGCGGVGEGDFGGVSDVMRQFLFSFEEWSLGLWKGPKDRRKGAWVVGGDGIAGLGGAAIGWWGRRTLCSRVLGRLSLFRGLFGG